MNTDFYNLRNLSSENIIDLRNQPPLPNNNPPPLDYDNSPLIVSEFDYILNEMQKALYCDNQGVPFPYSDNSPLSYSVNSKELHYKDTCSRLSSLLNTDQTINFLDYTLSFTILDLLSSFIKKHPEANINIYLMGDYPFLILKPFLENISIEMFSSISKEKFHHLFASPSMDSLFADNPVQFLITSTLEEQTQMEQTFTHYFTEKHPLGNGILKKDLVFSYKNYSDNYAIGNVKLNKIDSYKFVFIRQDNTFLEKNFWKISLVDLIQNPFNYSLDISCGRLPLAEALMNVIFNNWTPVQSESPVDQWLSFLWEGQKRTRILNPTIEKRMVNALIENDDYALSFLEQRKKYIQKNSWRHLLHSEKYKIIPKEYFLYDTSQDGIHTLLKSFLIDTKAESSVAFAFIFRACISLFQYSNLSPADPLMIKIVELFNDPACIEQTPFPLFTTLKELLIDHQIPFPMVLAWMTLSCWIYLPDSPTFQSGKRVFELHHPLRCFIPVNILEALELLESYEWILNPQLLDLFQNLSSQLSTFPLSFQSPSPLVPHLEGIGINEKKLNDWIITKLHTGNPILSFIALQLCLILPMTPSRFQLIFRHIPHIFKGAPSEKCANHALMLLQDKCPEKYHPFAVILVKITNQSLFALSELEWVRLLIKSSDPEIIYFAFDLWIHLSKENASLEINLFAFSFNSPSLSKELSEIGIKLFESLCPLNSFHALTLINTLIKKRSLPEKMQFTSFILLCFHLKKQSSQLSHFSILLKDLVYLASWIFSSQEHPAIKTDRQKKVLKESLGFFIDTLHATPHFESFGDHFLLKFERLGYELYQSSQKWKTGSEKWLSRLEILIQIEDIQTFEHAIFLFHSLHVEGYLKKEEIDSNRWQRFIIHLGERILEMKELPFLVMDEILPLVILLGQEKIPAEVEPAYCELLPRLIDHSYVEKPINDYYLRRLKSLLKLVSPHDYLKVSHSINKWIERLIASIQLTKEVPPIEEFEDMVLDPFNLTFFTLHSAMTTSLLDYLEVSTSILDPKQIKNSLRIFFLVSESKDIHEHNFHDLSVVCARLFKNEQYDDKLIQWLSTNQEIVLTTLAQYQNWSELTLILKMLNKYSIRMNRKGYFAWEICKHLLLGKDPKIPIKNIMSTLLIHESKEEWAKIDFSEEIEHVRKFISLLLQPFKGNRDPSINRGIQWTLSLFEQTNAFAALIDECLLFSKKIKNRALLKFLELAPLPLEEKQKEQFRNKWIQLLASSPFSKSILHSTQEHSFLLLNEKTLNLFNNNLESLLPYAKTQLLLLLNATSQTNEQILFCLEIVNSYSVQELEFWNLLWNPLRKTKDIHLIEKAISTFMKCPPHHSEFPLTFSQSFCALVECLKSIKHAKIIKYIEDIQIKTLFSFDDPESTCRILTIYFEALIQEADEPLKVESILEKRACLLAHFLNVSKNKQENNPLFNVNEISLEDCESRSALTEIPLLLNWMFEIDRLIIQKYFKMKSDLSRLDFGHLVLSNQLDFIILRKGLEKEDKNFIYCLSLWMDHYAVLPSPDKEMNKKALGLLLKCYSLNLSPKYFLKALPNILQDPTEEYVKISLCILNDSLNQVTKKEMIQDTPPLINIVKQVLISSQNLDFMSRETLSNFANCVEKGTKFLNLEKKQELIYRQFICLAIFNLIDRENYDSSNLPQKTVPISEIIQNFPIPLLNNFKSFSNDFTLLFKYFISEMHAAKNVWFNKKEIQLLILEVVLLLLKNSDKHKIKEDEYYSLIEQYSIYYGNQIHFACQNLHGLPQEIIKDFSQLIEFEIIIIPLQLGKNFDHSNAHQIELYRSMKMLNIPKKLEKRLNIVIEDHVAVPEMIKLIHNLMEKNSPSRFEHSLKLLKIINDSITVDIFNNHKKNIFLIYQSISSYLIQFPYSSSTCKHNQLLFYDLYNEFSFNEFNNFLDEKEFLNFLRRSNNYILESAVNILKFMYQLNEKDELKAYYLNLCLKILHYYYKSINENGFFRESDYITIMKKGEIFIPYIYKLELSGSYSTVDPCNFKIPFPFESVSRFVNLLTKLPKYFNKQKTLNKKQINQIETPLLILIKFLEGLKNVKMEWRQNACQCFITTLLNDRQRNIPILFSVWKPWNNLFTELKKQFEPCASQWQKHYLDIFELELSLKNSKQTHDLFLNIYIHTCVIEKYTYNDLILKKSFCNLASHIRTHFNNEQPELKTKIQNWLIFYIETLFLNPAFIIYDTSSSGELNNEINTELIAAIEWISQNNVLKGIVKFVDLSTKLNKNGKNEISNLEPLHKDAKELMKLTLDIMRDKRKLEFEIHFAQVINRLPEDLSKILSQEWYTMLEQHSSDFDDKEGYKEFLQTIQFVDKCTYDPSSGEDTEEVDYSDVE